MFLNPSSLLGNTVHLSLVEDEIVGYVYYQSTFSSTNQVGISFLTFEPVTLKSLEPFCILH